MLTVPRQRYDAIIVGAGPAGSTAAILLARAGWEVALVESQRFPRPKVCGECIAASNLPLLDALGIGAAFEATAGPALRQVQLLRGDRVVTAALPAASPARHPWGRALGRETLDALLLEQARAMGADVLQPCRVQAILGHAGAWHCELRAVDSATLLRLRAPVVIDAHGSWEELPSARAQRGLSRGAADLFAFKATFKGAALSEGAISVLALDGGYGGMVVGDGGLTTVACCIRRDRLSVLRGAAPGLRAGDAVQAWLQRECGGARDALNGAVRVGPWLACGPLDTGLRVRADDEHFRIGNAAAEAHPILGEGISMALQSAALLCALLLRHQTALLAPGAAVQAQLQREYAAQWRRQFAPRLRLAAVFAHAAMRPAWAAVLIKLVRRWPGLLTHGARWGGKVQPAGAIGPSRAALRSASTAAPDNPPTGPAVAIPGWLPPAVIKDGGKAAHPVGKAAHP